MKHNVRVNSLLKGLNVSLEDFKFYMSNDDITTSSKITVVTNGDCIYNPKSMTTAELVELRESLLKDIEEKEICRLYKLLDEAKGEVRRIDEAIMEIELRSINNESDFEASEDWEEERGPWNHDGWSHDDFEEEFDINEKLIKDRETVINKTASKALEDLKIKMGQENENRIWSPDWLKEEQKDVDDDSLSGTFPLTRLE